MSKLFGLIVLIAAIVWLVRYTRSKKERALCPNCRKWYMGTCSVRQSPDVTRCQNYEPQYPHGPVEHLEDGTTVIHWDWDDDMN